MQVMKFGGTSVRNAEALRSVSMIVREHALRTSGTVVVLSATAGTTNALLVLAQLATSGRNYEREFADLQERHLGIALELGLQHTAAEAILDECRQRLEAAAILGECTNQTLDAIAGYGELLSTQLFADFLSSLGINTIRVDARDVVITNNDFASAAVDLDATARAAQRIIKPLAESGSIVVTQGFIGATTTGIPTTLGRGGSDYTAALLGRSLGASEIQIWTDVSGVYSCDPRIVPDAEPLASISFDDVRTLALYGAKVLHPETVQPAVEAGIPVRVLNTFEPTAAGTIITAEQTAQQAVTALAILRPCLSIHTSTGGAQAIMAVPHLREQTAMQIATKNGHMVIVHAPYEDIATDINVALVGFGGTIEPAACIALCGADVAAPSALAQIAARLCDFADTTVTSVLQPRCVLVTVPLERAIDACKALHHVVSSSSSSAS